MPYGYGSGSRRILNTVPDPNTQIIIRIQEHLPLKMHCETTTFSYSEVAVFFGYPVILFIMETVSNQGRVSIYVSIQQLCIAGIILVFNFYILLGLYYEDVKQFWILLIVSMEMWWLIWRCGGSLVAHWTFGAVVPGSNLTFLTMVLQCIRIQD